jgi:peroxiredoxin Q/BCP
MAKAKKKKATKKASKKAAPKKGKSKKAMKMSSKKTKSKKATKKAKATAKKASPKKAMSMKPMPKGGSELSIGAPAPDFQLQDQNGNTVHLGEFKGKSVVLYFYPKDMTPGCTQQACDFRDNFNRLQSKDVVVLGVSKDDIDLHKKFEAAYNLNFPLLADAEGKVCDAYGVIQEKNMYGKKYMGISRTTYLIDPDQKIKKVYPKVKVEGHVDEILKDIQEA